MKKILNWLLAIIILNSCDEHRPPSKCNNDSLRYKLEDMKTYDFFKPKQAYYVVNEGKLSIYFKNYDFREDDQVLNQGEVELVLNLNCIKPDKCPDDKFPVDLYPLNSNEAVKKGYGVRPSFRTHEGKIPYYEIPHQDNLGPERAEGFVDIKSMRSNVICGSVEIMGSHGKSMKGNFSARLLEDSNEQGPEKE